MLATSVTVQFAYILTVNHGLLKHKYLHIVTYISSNFTPFKFQYAYRNESLKRARLLEASVFAIFCCICVASELHKLLVISNVILGQCQITRGILKIGFIHESSTTLSEKFGVPLNLTCCRQLHFAMDFVGISIRIHHQPAIKLATLPPN